MTSKRVGAVHVVIGARDRLTKTLKFMKAKLKAFAKTAAMTVAAVAAIGGVVLTKAITGFASFGDKLDKMSKRTGVSVESLSELKFAAEQSGSSIETVEKGIRRMQVTLLDAANGSKMAADSLAAIGLSAAQLQGLSPEKQFEMIMQALAGVADASERAALAQKLFGRAGAELAPMAGDMEQLRKQAQELGITFDTEAAEKAAKLTDAINEFKSRARAAFLEVGGFLAPFATKFLKIATAISLHWGEVWALIRDSVILSVVGMWEDIKHTFGVKIPAVLNWFGENWKNIFIDAMNAYTTAVLNTAKKIGEIFMRLWEFISSGMEGGFEGLMKDVGEIAGRSVLEGFKATTKPMSEIADRELTDYEKELNSRMAANADTIANAIFRETPQTRDNTVFDEEVTEQAGSAITTAGSAAGTFAAGAQFSAGRTFQKKMEKNTERTAKATEAIKEAVENSKGTPVAFVQ